MSASSPAWCNSSPPGTMAGSPPRARAGCARRWNGCVRADDERCRGAGGTTPIAEANLRYIAAVSHCGGLEPASDMVGSSLAQARHRSSSASAPRSGAGSLTISPGPACSRAIFSRIARVSHSATVWSARRAAFTASAVSASSMLLTSQVLAIVGTLRRGAYVTVSHRVGATPDAPTPAKSVGTWRRGNTTEPPDLRLGADPHRLADRRGGVALVGHKCMSIKFQGGLHRAVAEPAAHCLG